jgi:hypothetical protein
VIEATAEKHPQFNE